MIPGRIRPPSGGFVPNPPTGLSASFQNINQSPYCNVSWSAPSYLGKTSYYYEIDRSGSTTNNGTSTSASQEVGGGSSYVYKVRVVSSAGVSGAYSGTASCNTPGCCTPVSCVPVGDPAGNCPQGTQGDCYKGGHNGCFLSYSCGGACYSAYVSGFCGCW
jgi:hypothetical protein